jgi:O-antigen ligase
MNLRDYVLEKRIFSLLSEYGIYLLATLLLTGRCESFREIAVFLPPALVILEAVLRREWPRAWKNALFLVIVLFCLSGAISSFLADNPFASLGKFKSTLLKVFLIFLAVSATFDKARLMRRLLLFLAFVAAWYTAGMYHDYVTRAILDNGRIDYNAVRPYNTTLAYLLPFVPFALMTEQGLAKKIFFAFILFTGSAAILLTGYRGGWVSLAISLVIWLTWFMKKNVRRSYLLGAAVGTVITVSLILYALPSYHISNRLKEGFSTTGRYEWRWEPYLQIYSGFSVANKIVGKGLLRETMYLSYDKWYRNKTGEYPSADWPRNPHNTYLYILLSQGILGLVLFMAMLIVSIWLLIKNVKKGQPTAYKAMGIAIVCPFIGEYVVHGFVEDMRFMPLGFLLGLVGAYVNMKSESGYDDHLPSS